MADGALTQSMDDILAQIRKIIAEDPGAATKAVAVPAPAIVPAAQRSAPPATPPAVAPLVVEVAVKPTDVSPEALPVLASPAAVVDDLSDLFESEEEAPDLAAVGMAASAEASRSFDEPTKVEPVPAVSLEPTVASVDVGLVETELGTDGLATLKPLTEVAAAVPGPEGSGAAIAQDIASPVAVAASFSIDGNDLPPVLPSQTVRPQNVASDAVVVAPAIVSATPVSLTTLFANRVDAKSPTAAGLLLPSHIGRVAGEPKSIALPISATSEVSPAAPAPMSDALGALAAGLAASRLSPVPPVVAVPAAAAVVATEASEAPASVAPSDAVAATSPAPAMTTDQLMEAIRPVLQGWLDSNMPRILDGALKDALPDLIARAKESARTG